MITMKSKNMSENMKQTLLSKLKQFPFEHFNENTFWFERHTTGQGGHDWMVIDDIYTAIEDEMVTKQQLIDCNTVYAAWRKEMQQQR